jgi:hypothetical protein
VTSQELQNLVRRDESEQLEFKQRTAQFPRAGETLCAFMNGRGGQVLVGVRPDGSIVDQTIADKTLQDLAQVLRRFDPPIPVETERIPAGTRRRTPWRRRSMPRGNDPEKTTDSFSALLLRTTYPADFALDGHLLKRCQRQREEQPDPAIKHGEGVTERTGDLLRSSFDSGGISNTRWPVSESEKHRSSLLYHEAE